MDDNRNSGANLAEGDGPDTRTTHDGLAAVAAAEEFGLDIVRLDMGLPRLNGYAASRRTRDQPWGWTMFLLAPTAWRQDENKRRSAEFSLPPVKPVDPIALKHLPSGLDRNSS